MASGVHHEYGLGVSDFNPGSDAGAGRCPEPDRRYSVRLRLSLVQGQLALPLLLLTAQQLAIIAASPLDDEAEVPEQLKTTAENYDRCQEVLGQVCSSSRV